MSNQLVTQDFTADKINLIKKTIAVGATDTELQLFVEQCKRTGLDPITRQIYFIKDKKGKVQIQTSIDGFRLVAERSGHYEGQTQPMWCGADGVWKDVWLSKTTPSACKVGVYKKGFRDALYAIALFDEYAQKNFDGDLTFMWKKMPALMIAKVAESLALRKAFPNDLSGIYTQEEMAQAEVAPIKQPTVVAQAVVIEQTNAAAGNEAEFNLAAQETSFDRVDESKFTAPATKANSYVIPFGKFKGKRIDEVEFSELDSYAQWMTQQAEAEGKELKAAGKEFIKQVYGNK